MNRTASLSACGLYRYSLGREWSVAGDRCLFVMLNPSTADASVDDPTIRKCIGFAKRWGCGALEVVNLFAFRATKPDGLLTVADPVGPENDRHITEALDRLPARVVAAWGARGGRTNRADAVVQMLGGRLTCLRRTKEGHPEHPLYVPYETELLTYALGDTGEAGE